MARRVFLATAVLLCAGFLWSASAQADQWAPPAWWTEGAAYVEDLGGDCSVNYQRIEENGLDTWWVESDEDWYCWGRIDTEGTGAAGCEGRVFEDLDPDNGLPNDESTYSCRLNYPTSGAPIHCERSAGLDQDGDTGGWVNDSKWHHGSTSGDPRTYEELEDCRGDDRDGDGVADSRDTCAEVPNNGPPSDPDAPQQGDDDDGDGIGDACDSYECKVYASGIDGCELRAGDILLWRSQDPSWVETEMGDTYFSHAAIVIGYYNLDKEVPNPSSDDCVELELGPRDPGCELVIADAMPDAPFGVVALKDILETEFAEDVLERGEDFRAARLTGVPFSERSGAAAAVRDHLLANGAGEPDNQEPEAWRSGLFYNLLPNARGPLSFYCSSLVWWGFDRVGVGLNGRDAWYALVDRSYVTPDDLIESQYATELLGGHPPPPGTIISIQPPSAAVAGRSSRRALAAPANGGAHVMLVDDQGRRTGKDADGTLFEEIPGAWWKSSEAGESVSAKGGGADWKIVISGHESSPYVAFARAPGNPGLPSGAIVGDARPGVVEEVTWSNLDEVADLPIAIDDTLSVVSGASANLSPAANDLDPDEDLVPGSLAIVSGPAHGTASVASGGSLSYRSASGYSGPDQIRYRICDAKGRCDEALINVTVRPRPGTPGGGSTGGGPSGGGDSGGPLIDTTPPLASLLGKRSQRLGKSIAVTVSCNEGCTATASGTLSVPKTSKVYRLKRTSKTIRAGGKLKLKLKLSKKARRAAKRALKRRKKVKAKLMVVVSDARGNKTTKKRTIKLKLR